MSMHKQKILIVDDEPINLSSLQVILEKEYDLLFSTTGESVLNIVKKESPDLILLDVVMPVINGYEVCKKLKADPKCANIPIIFVTAVSDSKAETMGFKLGAVDYISKPASRPIVLARVRTHLKLRNREKSLEIQVVERTKALRLLNNELHSTRKSIIERLGRAAEYKDNETGLHVLRMSHYSQILGRAAGMSESEANNLLLAAPMHDIGKIGIPDNILLKPGKLNEEEWKVMRQHPRIGAGIIGYHHSELLNLSRIVALNHHEKWDGTGYPNGLKGEKIPFVGRIVAIADVFDALTTKRPYKEAWSVDRAIDLITSESGKHFEPKLVELFIDNLPKMLEIRDKFAEVDEPAAEKEEATAKEQALIDEENSLYLIWKPEYSVSVDLLDSHHKQVIDLLNILYKASKSSVDDITMEDFFKRLFEFTLNHFTAEEELMELHNYPDIAIHKLQHHQLIQETERQYHIYHSNSSKIPPELFLILKQWWITHILNYDMKYVPYLNEEKAE